MKQRRNAEMSNDLPEARAGVIAFDGEKEVRRQTGLSDDEAAPPTASARLSRSSLVRRVPAFMQPALKELENASEETDEKKEDEDDPTTAARKLRTRKGAAE